MERTPLQLNTQRPESNKDVFILIIFRKSSDGQPHIGFSTDKILAHCGVEAGYDGHCHVEKTSYGSYEAVYYRFINRWVLKEKTIREHNRPYFSLFIHTILIILFTPSCVIPQPHYVSRNLLPQCDGIRDFMIHWHVEPGSFCDATNNSPFSSKFSGCPQTNFFFFLSFSTHNTSPVQGRAHMSEDKIGMRCHLPYCQRKKRRLTEHGACLSLIRLLDRA